MKQAKFLPMVFCIAMLAGCALTPKWEDMTFEERIATADTFSQITSCIKEYDEEYENAYSSYSKREIASIKDAIFEAEISYMFSDGKLNGTYYYNCYKNSRFLNISDTIVIYAVSGNEIYVLPIEDAPDEMQDIPNLPNASEYKYKAKMREDGRIGSGEEFSIQLVRTLDKYVIEVDYLEDDGLLRTYALLPQQLDTDAKETFGVWKEYYLDELVSLEEAQKAYDQRTSFNESVRKAEEEKRAKEKELSQSAPKVGMTKDEVKMSAWGNPDKKNIDTYSWGTSEQWVYRSKGYVYFKNGVVTSVSTSTN